MSNLRYLGIICLAGQLMVSSCKQKDVVPSIDDLVGEYECKIAINGYEKWNSFFYTKRFKVNKSLSGNQELEINVEYEIGPKYDEKWIVKYNNGTLTMNNQEIARVKYAAPSDNLPDGPYVSVFQSANGTADQNSLYLEAINYHLPRNTKDYTYKYWAKKL